MLYAENKDEKLLEDVVFLPTEATFPPHFPKIVVEVSIWTTTCHKTVVGGKRGHAPSEIHSLQQILFLCQLNFIEITRMS